jgi:diadenosine tetraphosphate (Ap4A) HIT family hydrolase
VTETETETTGLPRFVELDTFPLVGEFRIKPAGPVVAEEEPREGDPGGAPCVLCGRPDRDYLWTDTHWRLATPREPTGFPFVGVLEPRAHVDLEDLDDDLAADLGVTLARISRAAAALPSVGRVHVTRFGDSRAHLHVMLYARPVGLLRARGTFSALWNQILPPQPRDAWEVNRSRVADALVEWRGGRPVPLEEVRPARRCSPASAPAR